MKGRAVVVILVLEVLSAGRGWGLSFKHLPPVIALMFLEIQTCLRGPQTVILLLSSRHPTSLTVFSVPPLL